MKKKALSNTWFVIMAGGVGARFWPAGRDALPKQFLDILGTGRSLLQMTWDRISNLVPPERVLILTHRKYTDLIREHLPEIPAQNILLEPSRNNTAPCVAYVTLHICARHPEANMVILPADHLILREIVFHEIIKIAASYVEDYPDILTLGMTPTRPDTGYGYILLEEKNTGQTEGIRRVRSFTEKPDLKTAEEYLRQENYVWNAGIFIASVQTMAAAFQKHAPDICAILDRESVYGTPSEEVFIRENYPRTPSISLDYAVMEKADNIVCMPANIGWSDIGTWRSIYEIQKKEHKEIISNLPDSDLKVSDSESLMIYGEKGKKILINGLKDMIIVDKEDILMIWPLNREQEIKDARSTWGEIWDLL